METRIPPIRYPVNGTFELTVRCNLHCKMCLFRHEDAENKELIAREKTAAEWLDMAEQAATAGTLSLTITGGEPLLRSDFPEIWEGLSKLGFVLTLYTNATLVTPSLMGLFRRYPPHRIGVSLYGASPETYRKVTGNPAAYRQAVTGIKQLSTLPSALDLRTTIIKDNLGDLDRMEEWIKNNLGEDSVLTCTKMVIKPVRGGCSNTQEHRLAPPDNIRLYLDKYQKLMRRGTGKEDALLRKLVFDKRRQGDSPDAASGRVTLYGCEAGMSAYTITHDGKLLGCQVLQAGWTNPFEEGFQAAWLRFPFVAEPLQANPTCAECANQAVCLSCPATRFAESGSPSGLSGYICANAEELMKYSIIKESQDEEDLHTPACPF